MLVAVVDEHGLAYIHHQIDGATTATIATIGAATGHVGLTAERSGAIAAATGDDSEIDAIEKHRSGQDDRRVTCSRCGPRQQRSG